MVDVAPYASCSSDTSACTMSSRRKSEEDESEENGEEEGDENVHRGWRIHLNLMMNLVRMTLIQTDRTNCDNL